MNTYKNPTWWNKENDSAWDKVKAAFKRDWDQTKHDMGGNQPDTDQNVNDTVKQATGNQPIPPRGVPPYEKIESAYRYGYGARSHYRQKYSQWNDTLEAELQREWLTSYPEATWDDDVEYIRQGWDYDDMDATDRRKAA